MVMLKGWKYVAMVGSVVGVIGLAIYPIIVSPMVNPEPYSKLTIFSYAITSRLLENLFFFLLYRETTSCKPKWSQARRNSTRK